MSAIPGRQPTQNRVIDLLSEIASRKGYSYKQREKPKRVTREEELQGAFRPDLVLTPAIGFNVAPKVLEVESTVNNQTVCKSVFSLLDYMTKVKGTKGFLVVPASRRAFAADKVRAIKDILERLQGSSKGRKRATTMTVLTFDQVRNYHERLDRYDRQGRHGQPPKFKGFDE